jgi:hypothetical protein
LKHSAINGSGEKLAAGDCFIKKFVFVGMYIKQSPKAAKK